MTRDRTCAPALDPKERWWTGLTGGNRYPNRVPITYDPMPGGQTVTLEEWKAGKRP